ncbi:MAG: dTDP-4-amino-4,6-dideoxygalactose transaminase [Clostridiales bacterium]|nr:dTDP-4-amino-4,6-dideoxygalactose transaminase [Clostridiales bacterium]
MDTILFNIPPYVGTELDYVKQAIDSHHICGDGQFCKKCSEWLENDTKAARVLLTTSGSHALDMAAQLCDLTSDDEVILPSYTFSSTANAFALTGAKLVFVDILPDTMNIDPDAIEHAITDKTKVICAVHYAGVGCDMERICKIADDHGLILVEDAAHAVLADYNGKRLGTYGRFGCYSFHETKNYSMGEGGAIILNNPDDIEKAEILREKGTDRSRFLLGLVDKYTWRDIGSSYVPSDMNAAYLWAQLQVAEQINNDRLNSWNTYYSLLSDAASKGYLQLPYIPENAKHNAHMFYIKLKDIKERTALSAFLSENGIKTAFHYVPLHSAPAGINHGRFDGEDKVTTVESERLLRLPMYYGLKKEDIERVCSKIVEFFSKR